MSGEGKKPATALAVGELDELEHMARMVEHDEAGLDLEAFRRMASPGVVLELVRRARLADQSRWMDRETADDDAIEAEHPVAAGDPARYRRALEMVEARHSKYALVDLANWLLARAEKAEARVGQLEQAARRAVGALANLELLRHAFPTGDARYASRAAEDLTIVLAGGTGVPGEVAAELDATTRARLAELEAEVERLKHADHGPDCGMCVEDKQAAGEACADCGGDFDDGGAVVLENSEAICVRCEDQRVRAGKLPSREAEQGENT